MQTITMTRKDLEGFAVNRVGLRRSDLWRMSTTFLAQLLRLQLDRNLESLQMQEEIEALEDLRPATVRLFGMRTVERPWVVYRKYNGVNYYLTLAQLNEGDKDIHRRIHDACEFDFPFLQGTNGRAMRQPVQKEAIT